MMHTADTSTAVDVVHELLSTLESGDIDSATTLLHPAIVWHNVSLPKIRGIRAVDRILHGMDRYDIGFEVRLHHIVGDDAVVLTERTDVLRWRRVRMAFWVCGTFEIKDGKIVVWRDYFSTKNIAGSLLSGVMRAALP